jgi:hypothetical protein
LEPGIGVQACNPSAQEAEAGASANLGYIVSSRPIWAMLGETWPQKTNKQIGILFFFCYSIQKYVMHKMHDPHNFSIASLLKVDLYIGRTWEEKRRE